MNMQSRVIEMIFFSLFCAAIGCLNKCKSMEPWKLSTKTLLNLNMLSVCSTLKAQPERIVHTAEEGEGPGRYIGIKNICTSHRS